MEKKDIDLIMDVSLSNQRVMAAFASAPTHVATQIDPETCNIERFRDIAWVQAEMLEREAKNIRDALDRYQAATTTTSKEDQKHG